MSEIESRDLRSAARPFKRDKNTSRKWSKGSRPLPGVSKISCFTTEEIDNRDGARNLYERVRPIVKVETTQPKSRQNKTPKLSNPHQFYLSGGNLGRLHRKADAVLESHDEASLAKFTNADLPTPNAMLKESGDSGILYSFDKEGKIPNEDGREIRLDELVDRAEEKWESRRMDRMVREYEVLNEEGETVRLSATRKKARGGSRQEREVNEAEISGLENDDECFEVI